ncbi:MAG: hypothetical protein ABI995_07745 [Acidobacteriota bacterium]
MPTKSIHVALPNDLLRDIEKLVGKRGRSAFLTEVVRQELKRRNEEGAAREKRLRK